MDMTEYVHLGLNDAGMKLYIDERQRTLKCINDIIDAVIKNGQDSITPLEALQALRKKVLEID